jgi:hypothetical protein
MRIESSAARVVVVIRSSLRAVLVASGLSLRSSLRAVFVASGLSLRSSLRTRLAPL